MKVVGGGSGSAAAEQAGEAGAAHIDYFDEIIAAADRAAEAAASRNFAAPTGCAT